MELGHMISDSIESLGQFRIGVLHHTSSRQA
jgi:hypothetical protein